MSLRVLHIITTLSTGGAESMLYNLLTHSPNKSIIENYVISLSGPGHYGPLLGEMDVPVRCLNLDKFPPKPSDLFRNFALIKKWNPHVIQTWLYHADLIGLIVGRLTRVPKILWNIRCSNMDLKQYAPTTRWIFSLLSKLSHVPDIIIVNSEAGRRYHIQAGYAPKRWEVLPNGFDTNLYKPDNNARKKMKQALGLDKTSLIVGMVARYDPMKDHKTFFNTAGRVNAVLPNTRFVLIGKDIDENNIDIKEMIKKNGLEGKVYLLGNRTDVPSIYPAFDIFALTSLGEGFPNAIGEAMACGVPCITTDVGDAAFIVEDTGIVVPSRKADALSQAWVDMLSLPLKQRIELGKRARKRIVDNFSISRIVQRYQTLHLKLLN